MKRISPKEQVGVHKESGFTAAETSALGSSVSSVGIVEDGGSTEDEYVDALEDICESPSSAYNSEEESLKAEMVNATGYTKPREELESTLDEDELGYMSHMSPHIAHVSTDRLLGCQSLHKLLSDASISTGVRKLGFADVRNGTATLADLHRSAICINGVQAAKLITAQLFQRSREELLAAAPAYPSQTLLDYTGFTKEVYDEKIDKERARARASLALQDMVKNACAQTGRGESPHPVLMEELITTLNQACILGFPNFEVLDAALNTSGGRSFYTRPLTVTGTESRGVHIECKTERELSIYSYMYPISWLGGVAATHLRYDISLCEKAENILYKNAKVMIAFPNSSSQVPPEQWCSGIFGALPTKTYDSIPKEIPQEGFVLAYNLKDETIPVVNMFDVPPSPDKQTPPFINSASGIRSFFYEFSKKVKVSYRSTPNESNRIQTTTTDQKKSFSSLMLTSLSSFCRRILRAVSVAFKYLCSSLCFLFRSGEGKDSQQERVVMYELKEIRRPVDASKVDRDESIYVSVSEETHHDMGRAGRIFTEERAVSALVTDDIKENGQQPNNFLGDVKLTSHIRDGSYLEGGKTSV